MFWQRLALSSDVELEEALSDPEPSRPELRRRLPVAAKAAAALLAAAALASVGLAGVGGYGKHRSQLGLISMADSSGQPISGLGLGLLETGAAPGYQLACPAGGSCGRTQEVTMPPVKTFDIDLDTEPAHRWDEAVAAMRPQTLAALTMVGKAFEYLASKAATDGIDLNTDVVNVVANLDKLFADTPDQAEEMKGLALALGVSLVEVVKLNVFYEISGACTSTLANDYEHQDIVHGRNLDYDVQLLPDIVINARFKKGTEVVFECTTFLGYVGCLTGMAPGKFSISLNQRDTDGYKGWDAYMLAMKQGAWGYGFFIRNRLSQRLSWREMVRDAASTLFARAAYLAIGGVKLDEAVILQRDTDSVEGSRWMNASLRSEFLDLAQVPYSKVFDGQPFVFVTNYDTFAKASAAHDARSNTAWKLLNALAPKGYSVESVKQVMDFEGNSTLHQGLTVQSTTFTAEMVAARGIYHVAAKCAVSKYTLCR